MKQYFIKFLFFSSAKIEWNIYVLQKQRSRIFSYLFSLKKSNIKYLSYIYEPGHADCDVKVWMGNTLLDLVVFTSRTHTKRPWHSPVCHDMLSSDYLDVFVSLDLLIKEKWVPDICPSIQIPAEKEKKPKRYNPYTLTAVFYIQIRKLVYKNQIKQCVYVKVKYVPMFSMYK